MIDDLMCYQCFNDLTEDEIENKDFLYYNGDGPYCERCFNEAWEKEMYTKWRYDNE